MDLHLTGAEPTPEERAAVDAVLGAPVRDPDTGGQISAERHLLLPVLHAIQRRFGWIAPGALDYACLRLDLPPAEAFGVASFYGLFSVTPRPARVLHVCDDIACLTRGAAGLCEELESRRGPAGTPDADGRTTWLRSPCLGLCERGPAAMFSAAGSEPFEKVLAPAGADAACALLDAGAGEDAPDPLDARHAAPQSGNPDLRLLARVGQVDPASLDDYRARGGYRALPRALEMGAAEVTRQVLASRLVGRGGAAFPAGTKWSALDPERAAGREHYLICNADESEPGTFKDRVILEADPFAVVESMTIAGFATGSRLGFLYVRGEYALAYERAAHAVQTARARGLLGADILRSGVGFDIEIRRGAGAYICGEETALFNSIEGFRGEPRSKPPFPTQAGLFGRPTLVNNVETLVNVPFIVLEGGAAYAAIGTERSTGTKLFCVSGHVERPGVYEVVFGTKLRELISLAGGVGGSGRLQAVLLGGAAGAFVSAGELDLPLTFEGTRAAGATLGSGVVLLFDDTVDLRNILLRISSFFRDESCGQCVPCRVGTVRQEEALVRLVGGHPLGSAHDELDLLRDVGTVMRDASICGLGQTASSAVESALQRWSLFR